MVIIFAGQQAATSSYNQVSAHYVPIGSCSDIPWGFYCFVLADSPVFILFRCIVVQMMDGGRAGSTSTSGALDSLPQSMGRLCLSNAQREGRESVWEGRVTSGDPAGVDHIISTNSTDTTQPRQTIRYRTERVVGNGSFGVVYQARCLETGELVAIKKVLQDKRFKNRELQIIRKLIHPNIVQLKHCFYSSGATAGPGSGPTAAPRGTSPAPPAADDVYLNLVL